MKNTLFKCITLSLILCSAPVGFAMDEGGPSGPTHNLELLGDAAIAQLFEKNLEKKIYGEKINDSLLTAPELGMGDFVVYDNDGRRRTNSDILYEARNGIEEFLKNQIARMRRNNMEIGIMIFNNNSPQDLLAAQHQLKNEAVDQVEKYQNNTPPKMTTPYITHLIKHIEKQMDFTNNVSSEKTR